MTMPLPRLTADAFRDAILGMCGQAGQMLRLTRDAFVQFSPSIPDQVSSLGRELHLREKRLTDHVAMQLREFPWSLGTTEHLAFLPAFFERIGDAVEALARCVQSIHRDGIPFSDQAFTEIMSLFARSISLMDKVAAALQSGGRDAIAAVQQEGHDLRVFGDEAALGHQDRLLRGVCVARASSIFLAMLDNFREIERYVHRMSGALEKALMPA